MTEDKGEDKDVLLAMGRAAQYLGVTPPTLRKYVWKGRLRVGMTDPVGRVYFTREALDEIRPEVEANKAKFQRDYIPRKESEE